MFNLTKALRCIRLGASVFVGALALTGPLVAAQDFKVELPLETNWQQAAPVPAAAGSSPDGWGPRVEVKLPSAVDASAPAAKPADVASAPSSAAPAVVPPAAVVSAPDTAAAPRATGVAATQAADLLTVGVGDQMLVTVFGQPDMSAEVTVNENGQVTLALVGTLHVGGLTPPSIEKLIAQRLRDGQYLRQPEVSVQVRQVRSQMVSVLGEVQRPGRFPLVGKLSVLDALATAGGLTARADRTVYLLRRSADGSGERQEIPLRLDDVIDSGRGALDMEVHNDDVIFVGQQKQFYIHGEVHRPGAYPMERELNIMRALSIGGGVTERGSLSRIRIYRKGSDGRDQEIKPDLTTEVRSGDVIYVDERLF